MKANKLLKTLAASTMSLALLAGVTAMPAMAVEGDGTESNKLTEISVTDIITTDGNTFAPATTMTIVVEEGQGGSFDDGTGTVTAVAGVAGGLTGTTITFAPDSASSPQNSYSETGTLTVDASVFSEPGIYHYVVSQETGSYDGITYATETYDVYLYVMNTADYTDLYVGYAVSVKQGDTEVKADLVFNNDYDQNNTALHDLVLYKVLSGNAANMTDTFQFTVQIDGETGEVYYAEVGTYDNDAFTSNGTTMTLTSGEPVTIELGNKDAIKIYSLDGNDSYTITETSNGYTVKIDDVLDEDGATSGTINTDTTVKYENSKSTNTPTGIIMNVAPYALMVVIAVAGVMVFMRKRVED